MKRSRNPLESRFSLILEWPGVAAWPRCLPVIRVQRLGAQTVLPQ